MAYTKIDNNILLNIISRKEFKVYDTSKTKEKNLNKESIIPRFFIEKLLKQNNMIDITSYNLFIQNYINPNTPYKRLLLKYATGVGKTLSSLSIAYNFINFMKKREAAGELKDEIGSVFIIGFSAHVFKHELLSFPELGFINRREKIRITEMIKDAIKNPNKIKAYKDEMTKRKKRLSNRQGYGYFKFMGYKSFFNRILEFSNNESTKTMVDISKYTEKEIKLLFEEGKISFNKELLKSMKNSLIIFDEIHNTYNSLKTNNWGLAIKYALDKLPTTRSLFLSATPIMHSPSEIIDLLNLLISDRKCDYIKEDYFDDNCNPKPGAIERIGQLTRGRISFLRDINPKLYASVTFLGKKIKDIKFLNFMRVTMSNFQYNTYKKIVNNNILPQEHLMLNDIVIPNPDNDKIGLSKTSEIITKLKNADQKWLSKNKIYINKENIISGPILQYKNINKISSKYCMMLSQIFRIIKEKKGKIFIYHNYVHSSGVLLISQILKENGILLINEPIKKNSLCYKCSTTKENHTKKNHEFVATRYIEIHGELDKLILEQNLAKFNSGINTYGDEILIIIGSRIIKEAYTLNAVKNVMVMSRPDNIPTLIQILGRARRKNVHNLMKPEERHVDIMIFTQSLPIKKNNNYEKSYEETKYKEKIIHYEIIQKLEKTIHENAIDSITNYDIIWKNENNEKKEETILDILPYKAPKIKKLTLNDLKLSTYKAFSVEDEINTLVILIKKLFIDYNTVWNYKDLLNAVKNPPFKTYYNTSLIDENSFILALNKLIWIDYTNDKYLEPIRKGTDIEDIWNNKIPINSIYDKLLDPDEKIIYLPNMKVGSVIKNINEYYILFPLDYKTMQPIINIELPYRLIKPKETYQINIKQILKKFKKEGSSYENNKKLFLERWNPVRLDKLGPAVKEYGFRFQIKMLEETIEYVYNIWLNPQMKINEKYHEFYFKFLYYYNIIGVILWASSVKDEIFEIYKNKVTTKKTERQVFEQLVQPAAKSAIHYKTSELKKLLTNSLGKARNGYPGDYNYHYLAVIKRTFKLFSQGKKIKIQKVPADVLPVGHYLEKIPKFYSLESGWKLEPNYSKFNKKIKENDIVIGYEHLNKNNMEILFKLRDPIHHLNITDNIDKRKTLKGSVCNTKSKNYLINISKKLGITLPNKINMKILCNEIKKKLILNELNAQKKKDKLKYYYYYYQEQDSLLNIM